MAIDEAEIKQNKFAEKLDELRAYSARSFKRMNLKESISKYVKIFMTDGKNFLMGLKTEYYRFLKRMVQKLIVPSWHMTSLGRLLKVP